MDLELRRIIRTLDADPGDISIGPQLVSVLSRGGEWPQQIYLMLKMYFGMKKATEILTEYTEDVRQSLHLSIMEKNEQIIKQLTDMFYARGWLVAGTSRMRQLWFNDTNVTIIDTQPCPKCKGTGIRLDYCAQCEASTPCPHYDIHGVDRYNQPSRCRWEGLWEEFRCPEGENVTVECHRGTIVVNRFSVFEGHTYGQFTWIDLRLPGIDVDKYGLDFDKSGRRHCKECCQIFLEDNTKLGLTLRGHVHRGNDAGPTAWISLDRSAPKVAVDEVYHQMHENFERYGNR